jgi:hypothetical protein
MATGGAELPSEGSEASAVGCAGSPAGQPIAAEEIASSPSRRPRRGRLRRPRAVLGQVRDLIGAIDHGDEKRVEAAVLELSRTHRYLAPLALVVGAFVMLFQGLRLLVANWRLSLIQIVPAMWIWVATLDLKLHLFKGREMRNWHGAAALGAVMTIIVITTASFYLNAVFAFAISRPGPPEIRPAFTAARRHLGIVLAFGFLVGAALGISAIIVPRWGRSWFAVSLGIVIAVMMVTYVAVPSRLVGMKANVSRRDKLAAAAVGGAVGAIVCTPPYVLARIGILLLGSRVTFVVGVLLLALGLTLQAGATGAVKAIKMSAKLVAGNDPPTGPAAAGDSDGSTIEPAGSSVPAETPSIAS